MDKPRLDQALDALGRVARSSKEGSALPVRGSEAAPPPAPSPPPSEHGLTPGLLLLLLVFAATAALTRGRPCPELDAYARRRHGGRRARRPARAARPPPVWGPPVLFSLLALLAGACSSVRVGGAAPPPLAAANPEPARTGEPSALNPPPAPADVRLSSVSAPTGSEIR